MKRTRSINLDRMRKTNSAIAVTPVAIAVALSITGCSSGSGQGEIFEDVASCAQKNPTETAACENAYEEALAKAASSAPKYATEADCQAEFGDRNCVPYSGSSGQSWFMPALGGFLFGQVLGGNNRGAYFGTPLFTSFNRGSPMYGSWAYADGERHGRSSYGPTRYGDRATRPKPTVTRTIARGGFGSTVAAKARVSRRNSSSSRSWGG